MTVTTVRRTSPTGVGSTDVQLLVLAGGRQWCTAIDLGTGGLVSAEWLEPAAPLAQLVIARGRSSEDDGMLDPMRPEAMALAAAPEAMARMSRRKAERWLRPLLHPETEHLLGFPGTAIPYWTITGERASVAIAAPSPRPVVAGGECRFRWRDTDHALPVLPAALPAAMAGTPPRARRVVVALSPPRAGHCYKVVAALL